MKQTEVLKIAESIGALIDDSHIVDGYEREIIFTSNELQAFANEVLMKGSEYLAHYDMPDDNNCTPVNHFTNALHQAAAKTLQKLVNEEDSIVYPPVAEHQWKVICDAQNNIDVNQP